MALTKNATTESPDDPELAAAEDELQQARAALERAEQRYAEVKEQHGGECRAERVVGKVSQMLDGTLNMVRKHPGLGVGVAAAVGFLLGRLLKRW